MQKQKQQHTYRPVLRLTRHVNGISIKQDTDKDGLVTIVLAYEESMMASRNVVPIMITVRKDAIIVEPEYPPWVNMHTVLAENMNPSMEHREELLVRLERALSVVNRCDDILEALGVSLSTTEDLRDKYFKEWAFMLWGLTETANRFANDKTSTDRTMADRRWLLVQGGYGTFLAHIILTLSRYMQILAVKYYGRMLYSFVRRNLIAPMNRARTCALLVAQDTTCRKTAVPPSDPCPFNIQLALEIVRIMEKAVIPRLTALAGTRRNMIRRLYELDMAAVERATVETYKHLLGNVDEELPRLEERGACAKQLCRETHAASAVAQLRKINEDEPQRRICFFDAKYDITYTSFDCLD